MRDSSFSSLLKKTDVPGDVARSPQFPVNFVKYQNKESYFCYYFKIVMSLFLLYKFILLSIFVSICFVSVISNLHDLVSKENNTIQYSTPRTARVRLSA